MTAKGFADTRARFETYDDILYFKNYRNAIFQILPASSFDINDELRFLIENNLGSGGANLEILKAKASSEKDQFDLNVKRYSFNDSVKMLIPYALEIKLYSSTLILGHSLLGPSLLLMDQVGLFLSKSPTTSGQPWSLNFSLTDPSKMKATKFLWNPLFWSKMSTIKGTWHLRNLEPQRKIRRVIESLFRNVFINWAN